MAIHVFLEEGVDVAIMEVAIGGQYDPTNVFERPVVCGVTALGFDHTNILGNTIQEIAWNKAGIFKRDRPAVVLPLPQDPEAQMQKYVPATFSNIEDIASLNIRDLHEATVEASSESVLILSRPHIHTSRWALYSTQGLIEGLADWLKAGKSLEAIEATKDRKKWRTMIANAVKQGT
ncbi:folylpolyglutamate synthase [Plakobranchus ocellatus]|uniref:Folylpolyglutamate synthase n=1 Tax=Plakobranchus ocellatus TaxID=259542 RepID=A0AAV4CL09_9GAST|nr:folylpolyglutamate synthase [Plakobranchus ocellatus]